MKKVHLKLIALIILHLLFTPKLFFSQQLAERGLCAHRGARSTHPENTIPAFREALRLGVHMIEFDLQLTKDDKLIVMHDKTVDRTTNGEGLVSELTYAQINNLDAGIWKDSLFVNTIVPTFEEVLDMMPESIWLNIHIKHNARAARKATEIIESKNKLNQSVLAIKKNMIKIVKEVNKEIKICNMDRGDNSQQYVQETIELGCDFIQLKERADSNLKMFIKKLKSNNIKVNYFGTNSPEKLKVLFDAGVDFVLVDEADKLINAAKKSGITP